MSLAQVGFPEESVATSIHDLSWLTGHWFGNHRGVEMEELWLAPDGDMMLGVHRDIPTGGETSFEFLRIASDKGGLVYYASPMGRQAVPFRLKEMTEQWVVFENADNEFPQRIIYLREGAQLHARIEGEQEGKTRSVHWVWFRK